MSKFSVVCSHCNAPIRGDDDAKPVHCDVCKVENILPEEYKNLEEIDFYPVLSPYVFVSIVRDKGSLQKKYLILEPYLADDEHELFMFIRNELINRFTIRLDELEEDAKGYLFKHFKKVKKDYNIKLEPVLEKKIIFYLERFFLGYGMIDVLMNDSYIEDISCDGAGTSIFIHHREHGSLETSITPHSEDELAKFVVKLAQKCGKHISVSKPMLDATMPDGSRIQMTLSSEVTTKGSTFTIRRFRADPFTPVDLIEFNSMSAEVLAYLWLAVEHGENALISGGTASGKTSILNAISLFIPRESKIVSIEETREINLPHPNWIPGVTRSGFGEVLHHKFVGEIDLFDLMKAALRQRPEYILVGEIRGKEAYVLFQAMGTGHITYSTVHADSMKSLIHRLEGKPINVPRNMLQALDIVLLQSIVKYKGKQVRRCKEIIEVINVDAKTNEILTNTVFKWDNISDKFVYSGKSFILEKIREELDISKDAIVNEIKNRETVLNWMAKYKIREFTNVSRIVASYKENPSDLLSQVTEPPSDEMFIEDSLVISANEVFDKDISLLTFNEKSYEHVVGDSMHPTEKGGFFTRLIKKKENY